MRFENIDSFRAEQLDFVPRHRRTRIYRLIIAFTITIVLVSFLAFAPGMGGAAQYAPIIAILLMALLCLFVVTHEQRTLDLIMANEYQNLLYSQALVIGYSFSIIVRREGTIVHSSDGLGNIFPGFNYPYARVLEGVFEEGLVRKVDRERIMGAIYSGTTDRLIFSVENKYREKKDYIITVEPLARPAGFCLVRGREYLGLRAGMQVLPDALRATSADKLDHLLATSTTAQFTTDQYGRFEYVNPALERLYGYGPGEILEKKLSLHHLVFSLGGHAFTEESNLSDYSGDAIVITKDGGRHAGFVRVGVIRNSQGKTLGATGSIRPARKA